MARMYVCGMTVPLTSFNGQNLTWWPHGPGQPLATSLVVEFRLSSENSASTFRPNTVVVGTNVPAAGVTPSPSGGSSDWAELGRLVKMFVAVAAPLGTYLKMVPVFCVRKEASCRTPTGFDASARLQNGDSTSSPTADTRPAWLSRCPGPRMRVWKPNRPLTIWAREGSSTSEPLCQ